MSTTSHILVAEHRAVYRGLPVLMFWVFIVSLLLVATAFGGMQYFVIALAFGLGVIVWMRPQEAIGAGALYLFACHVVFPTAARFDSLAESAWEMYYWAVGLLIITAAAVARIGLRRVLTVPLSAKVFLAVAFAAAVYGEAHGAATSYVLRQLYGVLLLIVYFGIALHAGEEELLLRRIRTFGVLFAFCFFAYYIAVFETYGFHKEIGFNGTQAALLAVFLFITGLERRRYTWIFGGLALFLVPVLIFQRGDVLMFLMALPVALALKLQSIKVRLLCFSAIALVALTATVPPVAQYVGGQLAKVPVLGETLPEGLFAADTLADRTVQLAAAASTVQAHPLLGAGLGSFLGFESSGLGYEETGYVDSGWGYILQKMGFLGLAAFVWFLATVMRGMSREALALSACLLAATLVRMFSQPVFLHFTTAPFIGAFAGMLYANRCNVPTAKMAKQQI